jgi:hypothetical protein
MAEFKYFGTIVKNHNSVHHLFQNILASRLLPQILPLVFYRYETWSVTLTEDSRLKVFENSVMKKIF